jgi:hypothetical protein
MSKKILLVFSSFFFSILVAQTDIPCTDLKVMLDDALAFHKDDKSDKVGYNEYTGQTEYKYHISLAWAKKVCIKEYEFEKGKIKSWGEVLVTQLENKDSAIAYAEFVKKELKECFTYGIDKTEKEKMEGREYTFVFMIHNQSSWTNIELFVTYTGKEYEVYIIF